MKKGLGLAVANGESVAWNLISWGLIPLFKGLGSPFDVGSKGQKCHP